MKILLMKKSFARGDVIFREGDPGTEAYLIRTGYVSIWKEEDDKHVDLATRGPGEIVGEMALLDDHTRSASITAKTDVEAEIITRADLQKMLEGAPDVLVLILNQLLERLRDTDELVTMYAPGDT